jgi:hypothetical protein
VNWLVLARQEVVPSEETIATAPRQMEELCQRSLSQIHHREANSNACADARPGPCPPDCRSADTDRTAARARGLNSASELRQEGPRFGRHPRRAFARIVRRRRVPSVVGTPANWVVCWAAFVIRTNVAAARRGRKIFDRAAVPLGKLIRLRLLRIAADVRETERTEIGDWLTRRWIGDASAGVPDNCAKCVRTRASEGPRHGCALAEAL